MSGLIYSKVELSDAPALFRLAHELVEAHPKEPVVWYAVGSYYYLLRKYQLARRYFEKVR